MVEPDIENITDIEKFFNDIIEHHLKWMTSIKDPNPLWLLLIIKGKLEIMNVLNTTGQSPMDQIAELIKLKKPEAYIFFSEGWCKKVNKKEMEETRYGDVGKSPDKKECLTVVGRSMNGIHQVKKFYWIKRDKNNRMSFKEDQVGESMQVRNLP